MNLRPYQSAASDAIFKEWAENDSTLVVMPTGGGKTILFADVIRRVVPRRALVIAHREDLIFQARDDHFHAVWAGEDQAAVREYGPGEWTGGCAEGGCG